MGEAMIHMDGGTELTNLIFAYCIWCTKSPGDGRIVRIQLTGISL